MSESIHERMMRFNATIRELETKVDLVHARAMSIADSLRAEVDRLRAIEAAARRVRTERNTFLVSMAGSGCERSASLEAAERDMDTLLDAKETR